MSAAAPLLRAYIDETGDRGVSGKSSPYFAFACVLVGDEDEAPMRAALSQLRRDLNVPVGRPLHWKDHVKTFSRRQHVTDVLTAVPRIRLNYVVVEKAAIPAGAGMRTDQAVFYNFAAALCMERILLAAGGWPGGQRDVVVRFGHVRGFNHQTTRDYLDHRARRQDPSWVPWRLRRGDVHFNDQTSFDGLQCADAFAGMLSAALRPDQFGNYEPHHLVRTRPLIREYRGRCWGTGFKWLGNEATIRGMPWWPEMNI
ncbi:hypothetical protein GCM10023340_08240 [Nocardioides marinquilinus]|uniref:DUF3800 domain-containing protein n=1 Tax=Nocardioides marinquilinus TaxID=1210400 RepID=A0ABP9PA92_9ACTN